MTLFDYDTKTSKRESLQSDMNADGFWNDHNFSGASLAFADLVNAPDQFAAALDFFRTGLAKLTD